MKYIFTVMYEIFKYSRNTSVMDLFFKSSKLQNDLK